MIISQKGGNYWQEAFSVPRTSISATSVLVSAHTLERPGIFLGVSICLDDTLSGTPPAEISYVMRQIDNTFLTVGGFITGLESVIRNNDASSRTTGAHILVWMKKRGLPA